jgi:hypothetical protein
MIELATTDFVSLTEFRLIWRFTDPKYRVLPPEALADVRPLSSSRAASPTALASQNTATDVADGTDAARAAAAEGRHDERSRAGSKDLGL